jgi:predicted nucleic acid-binding protein
MSRAILADAGPLFAAVDPQDVHHKRAQSELKVVAREKREVIVSYSTLLETHSLVLRRLGRESAEDWLTDILTSARLVNPTAEDYIAAATKVARFPDQSLTLFDAVLAVVAARLGVQVWTYDHHFDVMRTKVWRS